MPEPDSTEIEQLRRTAEMFEMILQATPGAIENYESLKEIYRKLDRPDKVKSIVLRLAEQYVLSQKLPEAKNELENALEDFQGDEQISAKLAELGQTAAIADVPQLMHEYETLCMKCEEVNSKRLFLESEIQQTRATGQLLPESMAQQARLSEAEKELNKAAGELTKAEKQRDNAEKLLTAAIKQLPDGQRERAEAEFRALSGEIELVPLDKTNGADNLAANAPFSRIDELEKHLDHKVRETKPAETVSSSSASSLPAKAQQSTPVLQKKDDKSIDRSRKFGRLLVEGSVITEKNLEEALKIQLSSGKTLGKVLVEMGVAGDAEMLNCIAVKTGLPYLPLKSYEINPKAVSLVSTEVARRFGIVPVDLISNALLIVMANPLDISMQKDLEKQVGGMKISYYLSSPMEVEEALNQLYPS